MTIMPEYIKATQLPGPTALDDSEIALGASKSESVALLQTDVAGSTDASAIGFIQSGAGALARTVLDKLHDTLSTKDFPNVQAAVNEAIA